MGSATDNRWRRHFTILSLRGPAYKIIVQVEGIRTQALVDLGAQVTLIRHQMLPKLKENKTDQ